MKENSLRKIIHDLNGELFLIRGYVDLTLQLVEENMPPANNLSRILERTDALETIIKRLRQRQLELEPDNG